MLNGQAMACESEIKDALTIIDSIMDVAANGYMWQNLMNASFHLVEAITILHENDD